MAKIAFFDAKSLGFGVWERGRMLADEEKNPWVREKMREMDKKKQWRVVFQDLEDSMPATSAIAKERISYTVVVTSKDVESKVALLLSKLDSPPLVFSSIGDHKWKLMFGSKEERLGFEAKRPTYKYAGIVVELVERVFRYKVRVHNHVGLEDLKNWFAKDFVCEDFVKLEREMECGMWKGVFRVVLRKIIKGVMRVSTGNGMFNCYYEPMTSEWTRLFPERPRVSGVRDNKDKAQQSGLQVQEGLSFAEVVVDGVGKRKEDMVDKENRDISDKIDKRASVAKKVMEELDWMSAPEEKMVDDELTEDDEILDEEGSSSEASLDPIIIEGEDKRKKVGKSVVDLKSGRMKKKLKSEDKRIMGMNKLVEEEIKKSENEGKTEAEVRKMMVDDKWKKGKRKVG
jgi:hypothetical protein